MVLIFSLPIVFSQCEGRTLDAFFCLDRPGLHFLSCIGPLISGIDNQFVKHSGFKFGSYNEINAIL
jgi:hypothetical protein